ncbi:Tpr-related protein family member, putative [Theileria annulata]|uniref:Tpr-related protein family member, putative n=1 Tax=Theileria annulata TaxID=5874 RepID=Q4UFV4_THEAN|nr:Tpr-related protein family member, putative [Theileria annulata]CAI74204.1 Tpr-related protein family member, putative [Theileria annulata]|eukprot:XP_951936.1 Tpr-related protein family member, putative [Theileria annulata]
MYLDIVINAGTLSSEASSLASKLGTADQATQTAITAAKKLVEALQKAASKAGPSDKGLKELLGDLSTASDDVVAKAKGVLAKYKEVESAYDAVKADNTANTKNEFNQVQTAFNELQKATYEGTDPNKNEAKPEDRRSKFYWIIVPSMVTQWLNFLTYVILLIVYVIGW